MKKKKKNEKLNDAENPVQEEKQVEKREDVLPYEDIVDVFGEDVIWAPYLGEAFTSLEEQSAEIVKDIEEAELEIEEERPPEYVSDPVRVYLNEIGRIPLLTHEEEIRLAKEMEENKSQIKKINKKFGLTSRRIKRLIRNWKEGKIKKEDLPQSLASLSEEGLEDLVNEIDQRENRIEQAKKKFIESNLRLVVSVAKRYTSQKKLPFLDLINEGNLGLMRAVEKFDYKKGYRFSTYAIWWIRQAISRSLAGQGRMVRLPVYMTEIISKCIKTIRMLSQKLGREPTLEEVAKEVNLSVPKIVEIVNIAQEPASLDTPIGEDGTSHLGDILEDKETLSPPKIVFLKMLQEQINDLLSTLSEREKEILKLRYGFEGLRSLTLEEVGEILGITRERVRQIEAKALKKLRQSKISEELFEFLMEHEKGISS
jgi:RNA polymerase primary sigma factor